MYYDKSNLDRLKYLFIYLLYIYIHKFTTYLFTYLLDASGTGRRNPPAISISLENTREFWDNIVVLSFRTVYVSKTFTELVQIHDWLKNFGWFKKREDITKYDQNQTCQFTQIVVVQNEVRPGLESATILVWRKLI